MSEELPEEDAYTIGKKVGWNDALTMVYTKCLQNSVVIHPVGKEYEPEMSGLDLVEIDKILTELRK